MSEVVSLRGEPVSHPGHPDEDLVSRLAEALERARSGEIVGIAWAAINFDHSVSFANAGAVSPQQIGGMFALMTRMSKIVDEA